MDDVIKRQDAIDAIKLTSSPYLVELNDTYQAQVKALKELPSAQQWIPCSERLPEKHKTVLITHRGGVSFGWHNGKYWERGASQNHRKLQTVTAWMPLPEPFKEETNG